MASIRELKKDIHYVTNELIIECLIADAIHNGKHEQKLTELTTKLLKKKKEFIQKINNFGKSKTEVKTAVYFKNIQHELRNLVNEIIEEISNLNKSK